VAKKREQGIEPGKEEGEDGGDKMARTITFFYFFSASSFFSVSPPPLYYPPNISPRLNQLICRAPGLAQPALTRLAPLKSEIV
jgi:hypothetical protein